MKATKLFIERVSSDGAAMSIGTSRIQDKKNKTLNIGQFRGENGEPGQSHDTQLSVIGLWDLFST